MRLYAFLFAFSFYMVSCQPGATTPKTNAEPPAPVGGGGEGEQIGTQEPLTTSDAQLVVDDLVENFLKVKSTVSKRQVLLEQALDRSRLLKSELTVAVRRGCWADADLGDVELFIRAKKLDDKLYTEKLDVTPGQENKGEFESASQPGTFTIHLGVGLDPILLTGGIDTLQGRTVRLDALRGKSVADLKSISIRKAVNYEIDESSRQCSRSFWDSFRGKTTKCYAPVYETDIYRLQDIEIRYSNLTTQIERTLYKLENIDETLDVQQSSWQSPIQMNRAFIDAMREPQCPF